MEVGMRAQVRVRIFGGLSFSIERALLCAYIYIYTAGGMRAVHNRYANLTGLFVILYLALWYARRMLLFTGRPMGLPKLSKVYYAKRN